LKKKNDVKCKIMKKHQEKLPLNVRFNINKGKKMFQIGVFIRRVYPINDQKLQIRINFCWLCQKKNTQSMQEHQKMNRQNHCCNSCHAIMYHHYLCYMCCVISHNQEPSNGQKYINIEGTLTLPNHMKEIHSLLG
jgi:uncharacterized paraquat-inducible protein A